MARARKATQTQSKLQMILFGEEGTGKSTLALQLAYFKRPDGKPFRVLYIDNECGSIDDFIGGLDFSPHTQGYTIPKKSGAFKAPLFSKYTAKTYFIPFTLYPASVTALESTSSATSLSSVM